MKSVFLSHASKDREIARQIASDLQSMGVTVWFDAAEIKVGDTLLEKINEGISNSDFIILLLSKESMKSAWVQNEYRAALVNDPKNIQNRLVPVLIDDSFSMPSDFSEIVYLDLSTPDKYKTGIRQLVKSIGKVQSTGERTKDLQDVIDVGGLAHELAQEVAEILMKQESNQLPINQAHALTYDEDPCLVFVIISFSSDMEPVFEGIQSAGSFHNLKVERVKDVPGDYRITDKIIEMITKAKIIVADLTHERPNVYFELGYARGLGKTVVTTAREGTKLHFDVKDWTCTTYNDSRVLERHLKERFEFELGQFGDKS